MLVPGTAGRDESGNRDRRVLACGSLLSWHFCPPPFVCLLQPSVLGLEFTQLYGIVRGERTGNLEGLFVVVFCFR